MSIRRKTRRRGILLLIVLSLLVLFVLVGITFIVSASRSRSSAKIAGQVEVVGDPAEKLLDEAIHQFLRGTNNRNSQLNGNDLLGDKYGNDFASSIHDGTIGAIPPNQPGQFLLIQVPIPANPITWRAEPDFYAGCELTMLDGPAANMTAPIVRSSANPNAPNVLDLYLERFPNRNGTGIIVPQVGDHFHVNGRPFNGTGAGYDPTTQTVGLSALSPNYGALPITVNPFLGGEDESWDLPDFQNNFLARVPMIPERDTHLDIIPSFHRPAVLNYFRAHPSGAASLANVDFLRTVLQRPNWIDHPNFTGSNPLLDKNLVLQPNDAQKNAELIDRLIRGVADVLPTGSPDGIFESFVYDVDNDSDGIPESVWVDLGLPPQLRADGKLYKPLFAIKCIDLDSRVNLNCVDNNLLPANNTITHQNVIGGNSGIRPTGSGYGPADIRLTTPPAPNPLIATPQERVNLISGLSVNGNPSLHGRYGPDRLPGIAGNDLLNRYHMLGTPPTFGSTPSLYGAAPDYFGVEATAIDPLGQPIRISNTNTLDHPYELSVAQPSAADMPYTYADMEFLLRANDSDAYRLPSRLRDLAKTTFDAVVAPNALYSPRETVTVASFDTPVPQGPVPAHLRSLPDPTTTTPIVSGNLVQLMRARMVAVGLVDPNKQSQLLEILLAPELRRGEKLNLNRILGNGNNDNAPTDSVVDVAEGAEPLWNVNAPGYTQLDASVSSPQELFARHLFALAMLLTQHNPTTSSYFSMPAQRVNPSPPGGAQQVQLPSQLFVQRLAQWAVNVVDFRDPDSVMTRFEYDMNPFNGWKDSASVSNTEIDVVWGCESPELVISETFGCHNRRVADTDRDDGPTPSKRLSPLGEEADPDLDQEAIPEGTLMIELFCTRGLPTDNLTTPNVVDPLNGLLPADLYARPTGPQKVGLNLAAVSRPRKDNSSQYPVWRLAITDAQVTKLGGQRKTVPNTPLTLMRTDRDTFDPNRVRTTDTTDYERYVLFTSTIPSGNVANKNQIFYNHPAGYENVTPPQPVLSPGRYAVIAPRLSTHFGLQFSDRTVSDQEIRFDPSVTLVDTPPTNPTNMHSWDCQRSDLVPNTLIRRPLVLIASADPPAAFPSTYRIGLNVSEPLANSYYRKPSILTGQYRGYYGDPNNPLDQIPDKPFDFEKTTPLGRGELYATDTYDDYRTVYLQRLANPLLAWNPEKGQPGHINDPDVPINPYITVDYMPIDLTVFNGHDALPFDPDTKDVTWKSDENGAFDRNPDVPIPGNSVAEELASDLEGKAVPGRLGTNNIFQFFASRERSYGLLFTPNQEYPNNLSPQSKLRESAPEQLNRKHYINSNVRHSLGYLNGCFGSPLASVTNYEGSPKMPFPWLKWNNRPYNNAMELLLVPASSPGRVLLEFNEDDEFGVPLPQQQLLAANSTPFPSGTATAARRDFLSPYRHLWNFFHGTSPTTASSPDLYRILDFVEVPSRYAGSQQWYNPQGELDPSSLSGAVPPNDPRRLFLTPFNRLSRRRDPGKINLNTVTQPVFEALFPVIPWFNMGTRWADFAASRRGYVADALNPQLGQHFLHQDFPSEFANPFRAGTAADLYLPKVVQDNILAKNLAIAPPAGNEATLLRRHGATGIGVNGTPDPSNANANDLLFASHVVPGSATPFTQASIYDAHFRYEALTRMGNTTTTHSNVFAVWVTVGYFEVEPTIVDAGNPDGYQLGREIGLDTGEVKRHRGFFIIDRSIPVAYERGEDHNVEKCIMLRRILEN